MANNIPCRNCRQNFSVEKEDEEFYNKMNVPAPSMCSQCRMQRLTAFRNERVLYKRKCDFSGKDIVSIYPPTSRFKVYDQHIWWSDKWDALSYGRNFDFSRPFFEQFNELLKDVPMINLQNRNNENSDYCNDTNDMKNCYLCFNSEQAENCYHCNTFGFGQTRDCADMFWSMYCELCYECIKVMNCYRAFWCSNSQNLTDCYFCEDCISCSNCFGCIGLRHKEYFIFNKPSGKEKYLEFIKNFNFSYSNINKTKEELATMNLKIPKMFSHILQSENSSGDYITNCKNCNFCFDSINSQDCKYIWDGMMNNGYDCFNTGLDASFLYQCVATYTSNNMRFCVKCSLGSCDLTYCDFCFSSHDLFGCACLKHNEYCVLNKQYTKKEYFSLVPKVVEHMKKNGEWGEFFPANMSPYGYNDTMAMEYFSLPQEQATKNNFPWTDYVKPKPSELQTVMPSSHLPKTIKDTPCEVCDWIIECEKDGNLFKIIPQEFELYKKLDVPIPHLCPDCRHYERKAKINPRKLWDRQCARCKNPIKTSYGPQRPEIVYCEKCYLSTIY